MASRRTGAGVGPRLCAWVAALPQRMTLPCVTFSHGDLAACGDEAVARQVRTGFYERTLRVNNCNPCLWRWRRGAPGLLWVSM